jgi:hypothetical protein
LIYALFYRFAAPDSMEILLRCAIQLRPIDRRVLH